MITDFNEKNQVKASNGQHHSILVFLSALSGIGVFRNHRQASGLETASTKVIGDN